MLVYISRALEPNLEIRAAAGMGFPPERSQERAKTTDPTFRHTL